MDASPREALKSFANEGQAQVSCVVAIATAMRIVASSRDGPDVQRRRSMPINNMDHRSDVRLSLPARVGPVDLS